jgi:acyl-CoA thioester hydrolase
LPQANAVRQDRSIDDTTAIHLTTTHRSTVTEDQIDHLGHMNVHFYGVNAQAGTAGLLGELAQQSAVKLRPIDIYTRHHAEQLLGARLVVRSGVVGVDTEVLRFYHELANEDTGALAATFFHRLRAEDSTGAPVPLPDAVVDFARASIVPVPAHGTTRSIALDTDPVATAPTLRMLQDRELAMRRVRSVSADECDAEGAYLRSSAPMLAWGGKPVNDRTPEMVHETPGGVRMGWASMETRLRIARLPRVGDHIQSFSAVIGLRDKTSHRILWAYDVDRGDLLITFEIVNLAFDIGARTSMSIPAHIREYEQSATHEDLAPRAPTEAELSAR